MHISKICCNFADDMKNSELSILDYPFYQNVLKHEKRFKRRQYTGGGKQDFIILEGSIPIMLSAPHAVNHTRDGRLKYADKMTGGIALLLHDLTGCHIIYSARSISFDPNYTLNTNNENPYQIQLCEYVKQKRIEVLIDLHGAQEQRDYAIEIGTAPQYDKAGNIIGDKHPALHGKDFICDLVAYTFDYVFQNTNLPKEKKQVVTNQIFGAGIQNTITKYISSHSSTACLQLEINALYRSKENSRQLVQCIKGLTNIVETLGKVDWQAQKMQVYKLWQSNSHKPQDKVEIDLQAERNSFFDAGKLYSICSSVGEPELIKVHDWNTLLRRQIKSHIPDLEEKENPAIYICLTNRLIESICGREWMPNGEEAPSLCGFPIVLYENRQNEYEIGMPSASRIEDVSLSSTLYNEIANVADKYNFAIYNRFTDALCYIDFQKSDYKDGGRVIGSNGKPAKKIMLPRYYKRLLSYLDEPFKMIRKEEYEHFLSSSLHDTLDAFIKKLYLFDNTKFYVLQEQLLPSTPLGNVIRMRTDKSIYLPSTFEENQFNNVAKHLYDLIVAAFSECYIQIAGETYYSLRLENREKDEEKNIVTAVLKQSGVYNHITLLQIPNTRKQALTFGQKIQIYVESIHQKCLNFIIGKSEYLLETEWTTETDDKNNVARLSPNMMSMLGVAANDKITIKFRDNHVTLRVLGKSDMLDYQIGIPAPTRKILGMNGINEIVRVHRDMKHTLMRNSQAQIIAILGTLLAVFQITNNVVTGIIICVIFIPIMLILVLNEERIKVK